MIVLVVVEQMVEVVHSTELVVVADSHDLQGLVVGGGVQVVVVELLYGGRVDVTVRVDVVEL